MLLKFIHLIQLLSIINVGWKVSNGNAEDAAGTNTTSLPYSSAEFCQHNEMDSDLYISLFSPCVFTFYKGWSNITQEESFSCIGIVNSTNEVIIDVKESKVVGWPDPCVANGPRCYDLSEYPDLNSIFTLYGESVGKVYPMKFPKGSSYVSVDCSKDYQIAKEAMKKIPEAIEPLANAIIFFGLMVLIGSIICCCVCCGCVCREGGHQRGNRYNYSNIGGVYDGPPVEAKRIV